MPVAALVKVSNFDAFIVERRGYRAEVVERQFDVAGAAKRDLRRQRIWIDCIFIASEIQAGFASAKVCAEPLKVIGIVEVNEPAVPSDH